MADNILAKMNVVVAANIADLKKNLNDARGVLGSFVSNITKVAGVVGAAFGVREVAAFGLEVSRLAGEAEGVKAAFDRLPGSIQVMEDLKRATGGTVSELELMKAAVQAQNFQIPIENLASLFEFATLRAQQTGQSVDYLVQSIILGIGRKSPLILDNLGISAVRLREKLKGVSTEAATVGDVAKVVGDIATEELSTMAGFSENASTKLQRLTAEWTNLKIAIGTAANETGVFTDALDIAATALRTAQTESGGGIGNVVAFTNPVTAGLTVGLKAITAAVHGIKEGTDALEAAIKQRESLQGRLDSFNEGFKDQPFPETTPEGAKALADLEQRAQSAGVKLVQLQDEFGRTMIAIRGWSVTTVEATAAQGVEIVTLDKLQAQLKELNAAFEASDATDLKNLSTIGLKIIALDKQIKKINELRKAQDSYGDTLAGLNKKQADLIKQFDETDRADTKKLNAISQEIQANGQLISSLNALKKVRSENLIAAQPHTTDSPKLSLIDSEKQMDGILKRMLRIKTVSNDAAKTFAGVWVDASGLVSGAISQVAYAFGQAIAGQGDFGDAILKAVSGFAKQLGEILIAAGVAMLVAKKLITNPYTAIAAGVALVAIAGAADAAISKSQSDFNGGGGGSTNTFDPSRTQPDYNQKIEISGEMRINGPDLVYVINRQSQLNGRTRG